MHEMRMLYAGYLLSSARLQIFLSLSLSLSFYLSLSLRDRHVRWATPTLSSNFYAPNINNFVGFIVICAYFYVFTRAYYPSSSPLLGWAAKYVVGGKVLHIARTGNESEIVFRTYLCLLTFIKMAFMAWLRIIVEFLQPGLTWQVGNTLMIINLPFTIICQSWT